MEEKNKEVEIWLNEFEQKELDDMIVDATKLAEEVGLSQEIIPDFMEILTTAFLYGLNAGRQSTQQPSLN